MLVMVLKNPYIFLIKHFKAIHLILTALFIYLIVKVNGIIGYYNAFSVGTANRLDAIKYVNNYYLIAAFLAIFICATMYVLLRHKKKPRGLYLVLIVFLILLIALVGMAIGGLNTIYISVLETKTLRLYRDLLQILVVFQYLSVALVFVRGLGFDLKKFNFVEDLMELGVEVTEDEEIELALGNTDSLRRKFNRQVRELRYYYFENKLFIHIILVVMIVGILGFFFANKEIINKVYKQGENFSTDLFRFNVVNSFVTENDDNNNDIVDDEDIFVIVKMNVVPISGHAPLNTGLLLLKTNNHSYASDGYYGAKFSSLGVAYRKQNIIDANNYLFIFKIPKSDVNDNMRLTYNNKVVELKPMMLDKMDKPVSYKLGDTIDLSKTIFGFGNFSISSADIKESFPYNYQYDINGETFTNSYNITGIKGAVLNIKILSSLPKGFDNYTFLNKYATLKYKKDNTDMVVKNIDNKTPGNYKEGLYISIDKEVMNSDSVWFDIKIRNKHYIYTIK